MADTKFYSTSPKIDVREAIDPIDGSLKRTLVFHSGISVEDYKTFMEMNHGFTFDVLELNGHTDDEPKEDCKNAPACYKDVYISKELAKAVAKDTKLIHICEGTLVPHDDKAFAEFRDDLGIIAENSKFIPSDSDKSCPFGERKELGAVLIYGVDAPVELDDNVLQGIPSKVIAIANEGSASLDSVYLGNNAIGNLSEADSKKNPSDLIKEGRLENPLCPSESYKDSAVAQYAIKYAAYIQNKEYESKNISYEEDIRECRKSLRDFFDRHIDTDIKITLIETSYSENKGKNYISEDEYRYGKTTASNLKSKMEDIHTELSTKVSDTMKDEAHKEWNGFKNQIESFMEREGVNGLESFDAFIKTLKLKEIVNQKTKEERCVDDIFKTLNDNTYSKKEIESVLFKTEIDEKFDKKIKEAEIAVEEAEETHDSRIIEAANKELNKIKAAQKQHEKNIENFHEKTEKLKDILPWQNAKLDSLETLLSSFPTSLRTFNEVASDARRQYEKKDKDKKPIDGIDEDAVYSSLKGTFQSDEELVEFKQNLTNMIAKHREIMAAATNANNLHIEIILGEKTEELHKLSDEIQEANKNVEKVLKDHPIDSDEYKDAKKACDKAQADYDEKKEEFNEIIQRERATVKDKIFAQYTPEYTATAEKGKTLRQKLGTPKTRKTKFGKAMDVILDGPFKDLTGKDCKDLIKTFYREIAKKQNRDLITEEERNFVTNKLLELAQHVGLYNYAVRKQEAFNKRINNEPSLSQGTYMFMSSRVVSGHGNFSNMKFSNCVCVDDPDKESMKDNIRKNQNVIVNNIIAKSVMTKSDLIDNGWKLIVSDLMNNEKMSKKEAERIANDKSAEERLDAAFGKMADGAKEVNRWFLGLAEAYKDMDADTLDSDAIREEIYNKVQEFWQTRNDEDKEVMRSLFDGLDFNPNTGEIYDLEEKLSVADADNVIVIDSSSMMGDGNFVGTNATGLHVHEERTAFGYQAFKKIMKDEINKRGVEVNELKDRLGLSGSGDVDYTEGFGAWRDVIKGNIETLSNKSIPSCEDPKKKYALEKKLQDFKRLQQIYEPWAKVNLLYNNNNTKEKWIANKNEALKAQDDLIRKFENTYHNQKTKDYNSRQDVFSMVYEQLSDQQKFEWNALHIKRQDILKYLEYPTFGRGFFSCNKDLVNTKTTISGPNPEVLAGEQSFSYNSETERCGNGKDAFSVCVDDEVFKKKLYEKSLIRKGKLLCGKENVKAALKQLDFRLLSLEQALIEMAVEALKLLFSLAGDAAKLTEKATRHFRSTLYHNIIQDQKDRQELFIMMNDDSKTMDIMKKLGDDHPNSIKNAVIKLFGDENYRKIMQLSKEDNNPKAAKALMLKLANDKYKKITARWDHFIGRVAQSGITKIDGRDAGELAMKKAQKLIAELYDDITLKGGRSAAKQVLHTAHRSVLSGNNMRAKV